MKKELQKHEENAHRCKRERNDEQEAFGMGQRADNREEQKKQENKEQSRKD